MTLLLQQLLNGIALGATYAMFAMGFGLMFATMGILNVAHGTFATAGAVAALLLVRALDVPFVIMVLFGVLIAGVIGMIVDQVAFQPLRKRGAGLLGPIITSIGAWIILNTIADILLRHRAHRYPSGTFPERFVDLGAGLSLQPAQILNIVVMLVLAAGLHWFLGYSRQGANIRAVGYNEQVAALSGVNPRRVTLMTAFIAAGIAGLAGVLAGLATSNVSHVLGEGMLLKGFAAVVVGGFGHVRGTVLGGLIIGVSEVLGAQYISTSFREAITFGLLLGFLILRPRGLFNEAQVVRA